MQRSFTAIALCAFLCASSAYAEDASPDWLKRSSLTVTESQDNDVEFEFETIQPLMQTPETKEHTVFFQGRVAKQDDDETINIGIGYRNLSEDENLLLGINAFYDATTDYGHRRGSVGAEAIGKTFTARANIYSAFSKEKKKVKGSITTYQSALDGYDFSVDAPMPYMPWMRVQATGYQWSAKKDFKDVSGARLAFVGNLNKHVSFEIGTDDNNYNGTDNFISVQYNLAGEQTNGVTASLADGAFSDEVATQRDLKNHTLDKVIRNNNVVVQTRGGVVIGRSN